MGVGTQKSPSATLTSDGVVTKGRGNSHQTSPVPLYDTTYRLIGWLRRSEIKQEKSSKINTSAMRGY